MNRRAFFAALTGAPVAMAGAVASVQPTDEAVFKAPGRATWSRPQGVHLYAPAVGGSGGDPVVLSGLGGGYGLRNPDGSLMFPDDVTN